MNNDLISREALKKAICENGYSHYYEIFAIIDNAPTINPLTDPLFDAYSKIADLEFEHSGDFWITTPKGKKIYFEKKRPRGKWIYFQYDANPQIGNWHCSECRQIAPVDYFGHSIKSKYCPNCGAEMREEANDETN